jgi:hypothetical protein
MLLARFTVCHSQRSLEFGSHGLFGRCVFDWIQALGIPKNLGRSLHELRLTRLPIGCLDLHEGNPPRVLTLYNRLFDLVEATQRIGKLLESLTPILLWHNLIGAATSKDPTKIVFICHLAELTAIPRVSSFDDSDLRSNESSFTPFAMFPEALWIDCGKTGLLSMAIL